MSSKTLNKTPRLTARFDTKVGQAFQDTPQVIGGARHRYVLERQRVEPGRLPTHVLVEHCFMLPLGNQAAPYHCRLNGREVSGLIEPGRIQFRAAGDAVSTAWDASVDAIFFAIHPDELARAMGEDALARPIQLVTDLTPHDNATLMHMTLAAESFHKNKGLKGKLFEQSLLTAVATDLLQTYGAGKLVRQQTAPLPPRTRARIEEYIRQNLANELSVDEIARVAGMGPYRLSRAFRLATGRSVWQFVLECRAHEAKRIITGRSPMPLAHVAGACGFESYSQFIAVFRKFFGETPSQFRRSHCD